MTYGMRSFAGKRPPATSPTDTAGLKWPPEMGPTAYAIVSTVRPNASATPANPIPRFGNAAASTALPQPPITSQNVPKNSAVARLVNDICFPSDEELYCSAVYFKCLVLQCC